MVVRADYRPPDGSPVSFVTDPGAGLQVGVIRHPGGARVAPHHHPYRARTVHRTGEVLVVRGGYIRADFYTTGGEYVGFRVLGPGDVLVLVGGGHGFTAVGDVDLVEVKQGPYDPDVDKVRLPETRVVDLDPAGWGMDLPVAWEDVVRTWSDGEGDRR